MINTVFNEWKKLGRELSPAFSGLHLVLGVALISRYLHGLVPGPVLNKAISEILIAIVLGLYLRNTIGLSARFEPGIKFALQRLLRLGIILLGLRLSVQDVAATGLAALVLVTVCITIALLLAYGAGRIFRIPPRLAVLIGVGTAICGNSAIVATAPVIEAKEDDVSFAVATITLFGLAAVILYPIIGHLAGLTDRIFGMWAGTAVNDTSQVVAVGAAFSSLALDVATVVKLTRNTLMAPIIVLLGLVYNRAKARRQADALLRRELPASEATRPSLGQAVPWFVLGFLALSLLRTAGNAAGVLPRSVAQPGNLTVAAAALTVCDEIAKLAILAALAAVGLNTNVQNMRAIGLKPFVVGLCVASVLAVISLSLILLAGIS